MIHFGKSLKNVDAKDLMGLVNNKVQEYALLEYKQEMPGHSDTDRRDFLAEIAGMANSDGGTILIGAVEARQGNKKLGYPERFTSISVVSEDAASRITSMVRDCIRPRLAGLELLPMEVDGQSIFAIDIARSLFGPHMVWIGKRGHFYGRSGSHTYPLDFEEIRMRMLGNETWFEAVRNTRMEQIKQVQFQYQAHCSTRLAVVFHAIPIGFRREEVRMANLEGPLRSLPLHPRGGSTFKYNLEGIRHQNEAKNPTSWIQLYRNGGVCWVIGLSIQRNQRVAFRYVDTRGLFDVVQRLYKSLISFLEACETTLPLALSVSLCGANEIVVNPNSEHATELEDVMPFQFDRDLIAIPEIVIESIDSVRLDSLHQILNMIWQAAGWPQCHHIP